MSDTRPTLLLVAAGAIGLIGAAGLFGLSALRATDDEATTERARAEVAVPEVAPRPSRTSSPVSDPREQPRPQPDPTHPAPRPDGPDRTTAAGADRPLQSDPPAEHARTGSEDDAAPRHPLTREGIEDAVSSQMEELQACYDTLLDSYGGDPGLDGRIAVAFDIDANGAVIGADIEASEIDSIYLEGCVATAMEDLSFDVGEATSVTWPIQFSQEDP